jgi:hypothetical protein
MNATFEIFNFNFFTVTLFLSGIFFLPLMEDASGFGFLKKKQQFLLVFPLTVTLK